MKRDWDDARLREALQSLSESEIENEVDTERVWRAVAGELSADERRDVIDKVAIEPGYAEAWRLATELQRASGESLGGDVVNMDDARAFRRFRVPAWTAAAAAVVVAMLGLYVYSVRAPTPPVYRGAVVSLVANDTTLARENFLLDWSAPAGARFEIRVTTDDLRVIDRASALQSSEYVVPEDRLVDVPSGSSIFWQVEATLSDGAVVESETFIVQLQ